MFHVEHFVLTHLYVRYLAYAMQIGESSGTFARHAFCYCVPTAVV